MTLWFAFALMTAAAVFAVLWPLGRRVRARTGHDVAVYKDQLAEIDRDRAAGLIADRDAEAARIEISRRLLAAADSDTQARAQDNTADSTSRIWRRRAVAVVALVIVPVIAVGFYLVLGAPGLPGQPLAARAKSPDANTSIAALISQVEAHIERNPDDGRGWEVLAPVYMRMGRYDDAVKARSRALALNGPTSEREAELGEAMVAAANGVVTADAKAMFESSLKLDGGNLKSKFYIGLAAEQDGKREEAAKIWQAMLAGAPADAPWAGAVRDALTRIGAAVPPPAQASAPGPGADDVAAAASLTPQQRNEMIGGMVARLAERLKNDGSDVDGWLRLVRAYMVLGERDKAQAAAADARRALAGDPDKIRRVEELVKGLGVEG